MIPEALLERSHREDVRLPDGRILVRGLLAHDPADAAALRARHEQMDADAEARRQERSRGAVGYRTPSGTIWRIRHDDGEIVYDTVRVDVGEASKLTLTLGTEPGARVQATVGVDWRLVRHLAAWIAARRTAAIDSREHDAADALQALAAPLLRHHPLPSAPWLAQGPETAAGAITIPSLITPGMAVWSVHDNQRREEMSVDERRDGGIVLAVSTHPTGRIFTVLREGVKAEAGGLRGLKVGHVAERDLHWCGEPGCLSCPSLQHRSRTLYRRCHLAAAGAVSRRLRPLTDDEAELLAAAHELRRIA